MSSRSFTWTVLAACVGIGSAAGQEKPDAPRIVMSAPLVVSPGESTIVQLRGFRLDQATRVRVEGIAELGELAIKKKEKSSLPPQVDVKEAGDTVVDVELKLPDDFGGHHVPLVVETPDGATEAYQLVVVAASKVVAESEPNGRLAKAQPVDLGQSIRGAIDQPQDVDGFRFTGRAGQRIAAEVVAARRGSTLDGVLSLFDDRGRQLATVDDGPGGRDPLVKVLLPRDGDYVLVLIDARDRGGGTHPYLLELRSE
jgi:hypothetical protein